MMLTDSMATAVSTTLPVAAPRYGLTKNCVA